MSLYVIVGDYGCGKTYAATKLCRSNRGLLLVLSKRHVTGPHAMSYGQLACRLTKPQTSWQTRMDALDADDLNPAALIGEYDMVVMDDVDRAPKPIMNAITRHCTRASILCVGTVRDADPKVHTVISELTSCRRGRTAHRVLYNWLNGHVDEDDTQNLSDHDMRDVYLHSHSGRPEEVRALVDGILAQAGDVDNIMMLAADDYLEPRAIRVDRARGLAADTVILISDKLTREQLTLAVTRVRDHLHILVHRSRMPLCLRKLWPLLRCRLTPGHYVDAERHRVVPTTVTVTEIAQSVTLPHSVRTLVRPTLPVVRVPDKWRQLVGYAAEAIVALALDCDSKVDLVPYDGDDALLRLVRAPHAVPTGVARSRPDVAYACIAELVAATRRHAIVAPAHTCVFTRVALEGGEWTDRRICTLGAAVMAGKGDQSRLRELEHSPDLFASNTLGLRRMVFAIAQGLAAILPGGGTHTCVPQVPVRFAYDKQDVKGTCDFVVYAQDGTVARVIEVKASSSGWQPSWEVQALLYARALGLTDAHVINALDGTTKLVTMCA